MCIDKHSFKLHADNICIIALRMKDRIKQYIEHKGISAGDLATMLDVQRSNISHILNGRNKPGAALIEKLLLVFPDLNARWLLTGKGDMTAGVMDTSTSLDTKLPLNSDMAEQKKSEPADKVVKNNESGVPVIVHQDDVEKMILLFRDGTFATYNNRDNK